MLGYTPISIAWSGLTRIKFPFIRVYSSEPDAVHYSVYHLFGNQAEI